MFKLSSIATSGLVCPNMCARESVGLVTVIELGITCGAGSSLPKRICTSTAILIMSVDRVQLLAAAETSDEKVGCLKIVFIIV